MDNLDQSKKVLESQGLFVDDLSRIRVVDPETADASGLIMLNSFAMKRWKSALFVATVYTNFKLQQYNLEKTRADTEEFVSEFNEFLGLIKDFSSQSTALGFTILY